MKSLMFRQNEAVMRLTDDLEQSQKREGSLQVLGPDDLIVAGDVGGDGADEHNHDVGDVVHGEHDHDCVLGGAEGEQEAVHRPGGQPQRRSHDGEDQVRFAIDDYQSR